MTIYELTDEYRQLLEMAEDPDVDPQTLADTMESIEAEIEAKADGYAKVMKNMEADEEAISKEIKRLQERKSHLENTRKSMKERLKGAMEATGKTKFKTELFSFGIQNNAPSVIIDVEDVFKIPEDYLKYKDPEPDKKLIKQAIDNGAELDFAHLEQTQSLRIR